MKNMFITIIMTFTFLESNSQNIKTLKSTNSYNLNHKDPKNIVDGLIKSIKTKDSLLIFFISAPSIELSGYEHFSLLKSLIKEKKFLKIFKIKDIYSNGEIKYSVDSLWFSIPIIIVDDEGVSESNQYFKKIYGNWYWDGSH